MHRECSRLLDGEGLDDSTHGDASQLRRVVNLANAPRDCPSIRPVDL